jgi:Tat protein translocase TatB subunit
MQTGELIIIAILALIVLGPTRLPELARRVGKWTGELRQAAREITAGLEAEVADIKGVGDDLRAPLDEIKKPFTEVRDELAGGGRGYPWKGPKPVSGPTPEDAMRDLEEMRRVAAEADPGEEVGVSNLDSDGGEADRGGTDPGETEDDRESDE